MRAWKDSAIMNMPKISIFSGLLLCVLGIVGAYFSAIHGGNMVTALIPLYFGFVFAILGILSLARPGLRKHLMHGLAMLTLLGALMAGISGAVRWTQMKPMGRISVAVMTVICLLTLALCVRSFIEARRARLSA